MQRCLPSPPPPPPHPCSYLPRLSLLWAGARASVPLERQRSLSLLVLGSVGGGRHLPVHPVSVLCLLLAPSLLGRQALSLTRVRCSFSGGPVGKHKAADFVKQKRRRKKKNQIKVYLTTWWDIIFCQSLQRNILQRFSTKVLGPRAVTWIKTWISYKKQLTLWMW